MSEHTATVLDRLRGHWGKVLILALLVIFLVAAPFVFAPTHSLGAGTYYCPMHSTYTSDRPGDCPICGMRLLPITPSPAAGVGAAPAEPTAVSRGR